MFSYRNISDQKFKAYMNICKILSSLSTCPRAQVGVIALRRNRILLTGYNGAPPGEDHCKDVGCLLDEGNHCIRSVHAEQNLVGLAAHLGISLDGVTLMMFLNPKEPISEERMQVTAVCDRCVLLLKTTRVGRVISQVKDCKPTDIFYTYYNHN